MHELGALRASSGAQPAPVPLAPPEKRRSTLARWFDNWMRSLGMALVLFLVIRTFLIEAFQIPSGSMERTLLAGDFLFVNKAVYGAQIPGTNARLPGFESPRRGDIIVFAYPKNPELNYVKRVIGAPGDRVEMRLGEVRVNGKALSEPYIQRVDPGHDVFDPEFNWQKDYLLGGAGAAGRPVWCGVVHARRGETAMQLNTAKRASFDEGSLDQYLREISQYPLITREEEVALAQRIKQSDPEALDKLVRSNLRFVVSVAKKYQNQGVSLSDLINEGNLGLIRAAHKFDETKGIKFISYAVWWIRQAILQALAEQSRIVRVPLNRAGTLHRIGKRSASLLQELGREPTVEEIGQLLGIPRERVRQIKEKALARLRHVSRARALESFLF